MTDKKDSGQGQKDIASKLGGGKGKDHLEVVAHPSYKALEAKLTDVEQQAHETKDKWMRSEAELKNIRLRADKDIANARKFALEKFVKELLPVLDSLERGLEGHSEEMLQNETIKNMHKGVELTLDLFSKAFEKSGIEQINPIDELFNPELHEAMSMQESKDAKPNTVLQVMQKGYTLNGRLVRPALVVVAKA